jgi:hypothetical protein
MKTNDLFSIDVDSHLKSVATHTFGSPSHYPVELVRAALKRGATQIHVNVGRIHVQVKDNGSGLSRQSLEILYTLLDMKRPETLKEEAVEKLEELKEYGLLAIFSSSPHKILIENVSPSEKTSIVFNKVLLSRSPKCKLTAGTRITIYSKADRDIQDEKEIITNYCKSVHKNIYLNKVPISKQPRFTNYLAALKINSSKHSIRGEMSIPRDGNTCTIILLDMGIPYRYIKLPPQQGYIFNVAIEYSGEVTKRILSILIQYSFTLYRWLCQHHREVPPQIQERIEELIFTQYRITGERDLIKEFSPFKILGSKATLTLPSILELAKNKSVLAVPRNKQHLKYNISNQRILSLTQEQADLLINIENIPVIFISPLSSGRRYFTRLIAFFKKIMKSLILFLSPSPTKGNILKDDQMSPQEQSFNRILNEYIQTQKPRLAVQKAWLLFSKGPFPSVLSKKIKNSRTLFIRRNHPLVLKAIELVNQDPRNIEMVMPIFLD